MIGLGIDIGGTSVKAALMRQGDGQPLWQETSRRYARPGIEEVAGVLKDALASVPRAEGSEAWVIGLCAPGLYDAASHRITRSANMPGLVGIDLHELVLGALPAGLSIRGCATVCSDALAAAVDFETRSPGAGRLLAISLGTGVGAAVLDEGIPLRISGDSPGHFGQLDVSVVDGDFPVPLGPDGGRGGLEGYIGLPALIARYGADVERWVSNTCGDETEIRALARALRIGHAIYRPSRIALLGGIGRRLERIREPIMRLVNHELTSVARSGWTLEFGVSDHHAAAGAARIAINSAIESRPRES